MIERHLSVGKQLAAQDMQYVQDYARRTVTEPSQYLPGDLVLLKQRKVGGLRLPTVGPFRFVSFAGKR